MSKRWEFTEDLFLAKFFDAVGDLCGTHDLGRPKGAAAARVKRLKAVGAWEPLQAFLRAEYEHLRAYYAAVGRKDMVEMLEMAHPAAADDGETE